MTNKPETVTGSRFSFSLPPHHLKLCPQVAGLGSGGEPAVHFRTRAAEVESFLHYASAYEYHTAVINMEGAAMPNRGPRLLYSFNTPEQASDVVLGSDSDVGGFSTVNFALDTTSESESIGRPTGKFFGNLRLDVRPELVGRINAGYAGFKTQVRTTLFGKITDNVYFHDYLALRIRAAGDPVLHKSYVVNVQTVDGMSNKTVWQQPLDIRRQDNDWETVYLPFSNFRVFTIGEPSPYPESIDRENILTVGVAVLGGNHHAAGPYELGLDSIWVANEPDLTENSPGPNSDASKTSPESGKTPSQE